ncbi:hypothetical protein [Algibacter sp. Ld11]|uniref:hypothetical protein n=1 Tax=Algibacter sp. Ld11 TaxID=649150 RepID=UPI00386C5651
MKLEKKQLYKSRILREAWDGTLNLITLDSSIEVVFINIIFKPEGDFVPVYCEKYLKELSDEYAVKSAISAALLFTKVNYKKNNYLSSLQVTLRKKRNTDRCGKINSINLNDW